MILIITVMGLVLGSFYNVCIYRIGRGESIVFPPSHCPHCGHKLKPKDLIPVLSYVLLKGRCRYCRDRISFRYPLVEIITALGILLLYSKYGITLKFLAYVFLVSILIITAFIDLDSQIIPNSLTAVGAVGGICFSSLGFTVSPVDAVLGLSAGGGTLLIIAVISLLILKKEGMGGGDIKLMGMIGLFLGWKMTLLALLFAVYSGGIISLFLLIFKKKKMGQAIPFGPFIGLGTVIALIWGMPVLSWYMTYLIGG